MTVLKFSIGKLGLLFSVGECVGALPSYQCLLEGTCGRRQGPRWELRVGEARVERSFALQRSSRVVTFYGH